VLIALLVFVGVGLLGGGVVVAGLLWGTSDVEVAVGPPDKGEPAIEVQPSEPPERPMDGAAEAPIDPLSGRAADPSPRSEPAPAPAVATQPVDADPVASVPDPGSPAEGQTAEATEASTGDNPWGGEDDAGAEGSEEQAEGEAVEVAEEAPAEPVGPVGTWEVKLRYHPLTPGAEAFGDVWLVSDAGRFEPGELPVGDYRIEGLFADKGSPVRLGAASIRAGQHTVITCYSATQACKK